MPEWFDTIVYLIISIVGAFFGGFAFKMKYKRTTVTRAQYADNKGINLRDVANSTINIQHSEIEPVRLDTKPVTQEGIKDTIRNLLKQIGNEKVSILLQQAKVVAIDTKDKEMQRWIEKELGGYAREGETITGSELPNYRNIKGKVMVRIGDGSLHDLEYPLPMAHDVKQIENLLDKLAIQGTRVTIKDNVSEHIPEIGGREVTIELEQPALLSILTGVERALSRYLESKIAS